MLSSSLHCASSKQRISHRTVSLAKHQKTCSSLKLQALFLRAFFFILIAQQHRPRSRTSSSMPMMADAKQLGDLMHVRRIEDIELCAKKAWLERIKYRCPSADSSKIYILLNIHHSYTRETTGAGELFACDAKLIKRRAFTLPVLSNAYAGEVLHGETATIAFYEEDEATKKYTKLILEVADLAVSVDDNHNERVRVFRYAKSRQTFPVAQTSKHTAVVPVPT